jgi:hypothetical protein
MQHVCLCECLISIHPDHMQPFKFKDLVLPKGSPHGDLFASICASIYDLHVSIGEVSAQYQQLSKLQHASI